MGRVILLPAQRERRSPETPTARLRFGHRPWPIRLAAPHFPAGRLQVALTLLGMFAVAAVVLATSGNARAEPRAAPAAFRAIIVAALILAGLYARTSRAQARMGTLLLGAGFYSSLWLLNGSSERVPFTIGLLLAGLAPAVFAYLMLAHPTGRLQSRDELGLIAGFGSALLLVWVFLVVTSAQPPRTPLLSCAPHCPHNVLFLGQSGSGAVAKIVLLLIWTALACCAPAVLLRRWRTDSPALRATEIPVEMAAVANAVFLVAFLIARGADPRLIAVFGTAYVAVAAAIPVAILLGLGLQRVFMGRALARFTTALVQDPHADPELLMAQAVGDPTLRIAYYRPIRGAQVDSSGAELLVPAASTERAVAWIERGNQPIGAVIYDARLARQAEFVRAAAAIAIMRSESVRLQADLKTSTKKLAASRMRLVEAADAERQRIERDLHDGVQQHLLGMRVKLDLAAEAVREEPSRGQRMMSSLGHQMDELLVAVRSLARGIYPSLLTERGLPDAIRSAARTSLLRLSVRTGGIGRYPEDIEVAVYFCSIEAIQNIVKHAGQEVEATVHLWQDKQRLRFEVRDTGTGFNPGRVQGGSGLANMRDRIEAVGGRLTVTSSEGSGTSVRGSVPVG